jgi:hypothetical protein
MTRAEARATAKEAYIYGFPMVDSYRVQYSHSVDRDCPKFSQAPGSGTPRPWLGADLRGEPLVLSVPALTDRCYAAQFIDMYTFDFAYVGSRATGTEAGTYLLTGPSWRGEKPAGVNCVIRAETEFVFVIFRTQPMSQGDIEGVTRAQADYTVQTLSSFLSKPAPLAPAAVDFVKPLTSDEERTSPEFFNILNFILRFCPTHPSEGELMARFARLGIGAGLRFDPSTFPPEIRMAIQEGMADAWDAFAHGEGGFQNGTPKQACPSPAHLLDATGAEPDGAKHRYTLRFAQLPPVKAFWSLTMHELPAPGGPCWAVLRMSSGGGSAPPPPVASS